MIAVPIPKPPMAWIVPPSSYFERTFEDDSATALAPPKLVEEYRNKISFLNLKATRDLAAEYAGCWIAVVNGDVAASSTCLRECRRLAPRSAFIVFPAVCAHEARGVKLTIEFYPTT
eukprot:TRINITY_DN24102_c0_g1_i1.p1 TRINITY_DN24102_c0_g1~~TRINITY_DN24102_c0_g1_i1.p1  ORF type:complete len:117 (-),score=8.68 TRINITY_DN24102_c0_g1_i1:173-523(-)